MAEYLDLQKLINAAPDGTTIEIPPGAWYGDQVHVNKMIGLRGGLRRGTKLHHSFVLSNYASWFTLSNMELAGDGGTLFDVGVCEEGACYYPTFRDILVTGYDVPFNWRRAAGFTVADSILNPRLCASVIRNANNVDEGDSSFINVKIDTDSSYAGNAIEQYSSGGFKIIGGKILHFRRAYYAEIMGGQTSDLQIIGLSAELQSDRVFHICRHEDAGFKNVKIDAQTAGDAGALFAEGISNISFRGEYECGTKDAVHVKNGRNIRIDAVLSTSGVGLTAYEAVSNLSYTGTVFDGCRTNVVDAPPAPAAPEKAPRPAWWPWFLPW